MYIEKDNPEPGKERRSDNYNVCKRRAKLVIGNCKRKADEDFGKHIKLDL